MCLLFFLCLYFFLFLCAWFLPNLCCLSHWHLTLHPSPWPLPVLFDINIVLGRVAVWGLFLSAPWL